MDLNKIDRATLKEVIKEIIAEDATLLKEVVKELLVENQIIVADEQDTRRKKIEQLINEDFDKYDDVFKALA